VSRFVAVKLLLLAAVKEKEKKNKMEEIPPPPRFIHQSCGASRIPKLAMG
jgi:hypothetical protein